MIRRQSYTPQQALQKVKHFCAYQERCHQEVKEKLYSFGLRKNEVEETISKLIEENYLNEERFAIQFAGGRFRMKQWGKVKIRYELKQKQVGEYCIKKALAAISEDDYGKTLARLVADKWEKLKGEENTFIKKSKVQGQLLQKGFETDRITDALREIQEDT